MITDIHTHNLNAPNALICVEPSEFAPSEGKLYAVGIHPGTPLPASPPKLSV